MTLIKAYTATSCLGVGLDAHSDAILRRRSGLRKNDFPGCDIETWIGRLDDESWRSLPAHLEHFDGRNNRLAWTGLQADGFAGKVSKAIESSSSDRVGVIVGTSTSSIGETELAYSHLTEDRRFKPEFVKPRVHNPHSPGDFVACALGVSGPSMTISTACSSSAKVFAAAARWLELDVVDMVVVGGIDTLCLSVLFGFHSLQLVSETPCRPFDVARSGINIGEAAGFALLSRGRHEKRCPRLVGFGESSDSYHMSSPHPDGLGAKLAAVSALQRAGLEPEDIDYVNLHGTGTKQNDAAEGRAMRALFPRGVRASSTKGWTGHTLGAAGILEAIICLNVLDCGILPGTINSSSIDPDCGFDILTQNLEAEAKIVMSNSYGFGGNNCSLIFSQP